MGPAIIISAAKNRIIKIIQLVGRLSKDSRIEGFISLKVNPKMEATLIRAKIINKLKIRSTGNVKKYIISIPMDIFKLAQKQYQYLFCRTKLKRLMLKGSSKTIWREMESLNETSKKYPQTIVKIRAN